MSTFQVTYKSTHRRHKSQTTTFKFQVKMWMNKVEFQVNSQFKKSQFNNWKSKAKSKDKICKYQVKSKARTSPLTFFNEFYCHKLRYTHTHKKETITVARQRYFLFWERAAKNSRTSRFDPSSETFWARGERFERVFEREETFWVKVLQIFRTKDKILLSDWKCLLSTYGSKSPP